MRAAIYARVSTGRQERDQTIDSQVAALRQWAEAHGHDLQARHVFIDEGCSGARLDRPGLDRLRDAAREGEIDLIAVYTPDRLARRYAYQILLLEEFRKAGCAVEFVERPISDDPRDHLLLQIQGAIAEYKRAVLSERFRRGKLQKARAGHWLAGEAPYGYRYVCKRDGVPGHVVVDEAEAVVVRMLYRWLIDEQMSVRQIVKRLAGGSWRPRCGSRLWSKCVVHHILSDPFYKGVAYANRFAYVAPKRRRTTTRRKTDNVCRQPRSQEEWIPVPVPAIVDEATHQQAAAQLARNAARSFRNNRRQKYLLRCLLVCRTCGRAMFGLTYPAGPGRGAHSYYKCHGKDADSERICPQSRAKVEELDAAVWDHVTRLLDDPATLLAQFEAYARRADEARAGECAEEQRLAAQLRRLDREEQRLVDAYQAEAIDLAELRERQSQIAGRRGILKAQYDQQVLLRSQRQTAQQILHDVTDFCERIRAGLDRASFADKQRIVQLLVDRIIVGEDSLEIRHVIPLRGQDPAAIVMPSEPQNGVGGPTEVNASNGVDERLRPDGVGPTPDVRGPAVIHRVVPGVSVGVDEPGVPREERRRRIARAADRQVEHGVRVRRVTDVHPGVGRPPRGQQRHRGVVGVECGRQPDAVAHQPVQRFEHAGTRADLVAQRGPRDVPPEPAKDRLLPVQRQVVDVLRHDDVREQSGGCGAARDRIWRERPLSHLRVVASAFATSARVGRPHDLSDEKRRGSVVEPLGYVGPDPDAGLFATRIRPLCLGQVDLDPLSRQVGRAPATTVTASLRARGVGRRVRCEGCVGGWRWRVGIGNLIERGRPGDALALPAETHPHEPVDVGLLPLDGGPQFDHGAEQFLVHPPQVRDLGPKDDEFGVALRCGRHIPATRDLAGWFRARHGISM